MKKIVEQNLNYILIAIIGILLILLGVVLTIRIPSSKVYQSSSNKADSSVKDETSIEDQVGESKPSNPEVTATPVPTPSQVPIATPSPVPSTVPPTSSVPVPQEEKITEEALIQYFDGEVSEVDLHASDLSFTDKVKIKFHDLVDFIFYGKEIKGYTFSELTTTAKLKVISLALKLDHKIDEYFPNYKEKIKESYINIKGKLAAFYLELTETLCESVGEVTCNQAKQDFQSMKDSFGFTWELLKELGSKGKEKILEFYWNLRDAE